MHLPIAILFLVVFYENKRKVLGNIEKERAAPESALDFCCNSGYNDELNRENV